MRKTIVEIGHHRLRLSEFLRSATGAIRVASAYVTDTKLLANAKDARLLIGPSIADCATGVVSLKSLRALLAAGVQCRVLPEKPKLHAKVYIFGDECAVVTSSNLTSHALDLNIEAGVCVSGREVIELIEWFDSLWDAAPKLNPATIDIWEQQSEPLRRQFARLLNRAGRKRLAQPASGKARAKTKKRTQSYFLCNTDRAWSDTLPSGEYVTEATMLAKGYAAAWETFNYLSHMQDVKADDLIFMYANGVGIIAVGRALDKCESVKYGRSDRLYNGTKELEWRIPVQWIRPFDDQNGIPWTVWPGTFLNISDDQFEKRRERVMRHYFAE